MTDKPKTFADLTKDQQSEIRGGEALGRLIEFDEWKFYQKILEMHIENNRRTLEGSLPNPSVDDGVALAIKDAVLKGTILGLRLALNIPSVSMGAAKDLRKQLLGNESGDAP